MKDVNMKRLMGALVFGVLVIFSSYGLKVQSGATAKIKDFSGQTLSKQDFNSQDLSGANFSKAKLDGINFNQTILVGADFTGAMINNTIFNGVNLSEADFSNSELTLVQFKGIGTGLVIKNSKFDGAKLNVIAGLADLLNNNQTLATGSSFRGANFQNISFASIKFLDKFDFTGAIFAGSGVSFENAEFGPDALFVNTQFNGEVFTPTFVNSDLYPAGAYYGAKQGMNFFSVRMNGTNFSNAIFRYANLNNMQLIDVDLSRAVFIGCKIVSCLILGDLSCTNFSESLIKGNLFSNNNLTNSLNVNKYTASKLTNSNLLDYIDHDPDGQISTNIFPMGIVYGRPAALTRFDCEPQVVNK
jgi:uncharacterized protein YjbI with pentapeptide repeats